MNNLTASQIHAVVRSAVLAPSADNRHHVAFEPTAGGMRIWADDQYANCAEPHRRQLTVFSFGAVLENALIQASAYALDSAVRAFPDPDRPKLVCELEWRPADAPVDPLLRAIDQRHTNRKFFKGPPLAELELALLADEVRRYESVRIHWCDDAERRSALLGQVRRAEAERFRQPRLHEELFSSIDWSAGWKATSVEGLPPGALEVEVPLRPGFRAMSSWPVMRVLSLLQMHRLLGIRAADLPCRLSPHLGVLSATDARTSTVIEAGRAFQRLWLQATLQGLALQPMAASIALALQPVADGWVSGEVQRALQMGWTRLIGADSPMMVFRLGRAPTPAVRASRRPVQSYLMQ